MLIVDSLSVTIHTGSCTFPCAAGFLRFARIGELAKRPTTNIQSAYSEALGGTHGPADRQTVYAASLPVKRTSGSMAPFVQHVRVDRGRPHLFVA